ncbi:MAG: phosphoenolpyruvate--protein phosphotransferase [Deltaproteobacteria bacterium]|jgi:phosphotransferase system enzyme I (PtsI)|nr:phosphoenolpyruvate--protein phosphotransferase [Deltaproteobacteria bacterium]
MITLQGKGVSVGIAEGPISFLSRSSHSVQKQPIEDVAKELERLNAAIASASAELDSLAISMVDKIGQENALLFEVHRMMLADSDYRDPIEEIITNEKVCAEYAVNTAGSRLAQEFADMDDDYMKARSIDIFDVSKRVIRILSGEKQDSSANDQPVILAADDFTPSETAQLDRGKVLALISRQGAANSHTAIFARTMGIPAIISFGAFLSEDLAGKYALVDGETGVLYIEPEPHILGELEIKAKQVRAEKERLEQFRGKPTVTQKGQKLKLYANIGSVHDAGSATMGDAEGIGLFRSEFLYLGRNDYPDEDTQYDSYRKVLEKMGNKEVIIRTLDIGADKQVHYFNLPKEENPALGLRAIRICLTRPELFETQLRAIYRASVYGNAAIMFPMITSLSELRHAKELAAKAREDLKAKGIPYKKNVPLGIMIETPAAAIISDILAKEADFFSIGTNDLTQYTLAIDRQNDSIASFCDIHHEAILRLIKLTCENAHKEGIICGICGSLGADPSLTKFFVEIGIDELSVEPSVILKLRSLISEY